MSAVLPMVSQLATATVLPLHRDVDRRRGTGRHPAPSKAVRLAFGEAPDGRMVSVAKVDRGKAAGVVAVATAQPDPANGRQRSSDFLLGAAAAAFNALQDAEPDLIAEAERAATQAAVGPVDHRQTISQAEMVAGLLASAGNPRRSVQAKARIKEPATCCVTWCADQSRKDDSCAISD